MKRTHGDRNTRLYHIWENMKQRCFNPKTPKYHNYGGRGITICEDWINYISFKEWAVNNGYDLKLTLDRKDNNLNYCPENCQWITNFEQQANKRDSRFITYQGETLIVSEWARRFNLNRGIILYRLKVNKPLSELFLPPQNFSTI